MNLRQYYFLNYLTNLNLVICTKAFRSIFSLQLRLKGSLYSKLHGKIPYLSIIAKG